MPGKCKSNEVWNSKSKKCISKPTEREAAYKVMDLDFHMVDHKRRQDLMRSLMKDVDLNPAKRDSAAQVHKQKTMKWDKEKEERRKKLVKEYRNLGY